MLRSDVCINVAFAFGDVWAVGAMELRGNSTLKTQVALHAVEVRVVAQAPRTLVAGGCWGQHNCQTEPEINKRISYTLIYLLIKKVPEE